MGKKKKDVKTTVVITDHKNIDQLLIYTNYVIKMFDAVFTTTHAPEIKTHDNSVSMMLFDMALLYLKYDVEDNIVCVVSLFDEAPVLLIAELMSCLKDIFKEHIYINEDTYIQDLANRDLIWGREDIDDHHEKAWGRKVTHTVMFDDTMAGHS